MMMIDDDDDDYDDDDGDDDDDDDEDDYDDDNNDEAQFLCSICKLFMFNIMLSFPSVGFIIVLLWVGFPLGIRGRTACHGARNVTR